MFRYREAFGVWKPASTLAEAIAGFADIPGDKQAEIQEVVDGSFVKTEWVFSAKSQRGFRQMTLQYPLNPEEMNPENYYD